MELFSPQIQASIGTYTFSKGIELEVNSAADTCYDWAKIRFVSPFEQKVSIAKRAPATIRIGYNGQFETIFTGYATCDFTSGGNGNEVLLKDGMLLLEDVRINNTFVQATPQEIVNYVAGIAGVEKLLLDDASYSPITRLPVLSQNGIRVIRSLDDFWNIHAKFYFQGGVLHWGKRAEQAQLYCFEYAKNIISLVREGGFWVLQTVSVPFIQHSQTIRVTHPALSGEFVVHRVRTSTFGPGFIRTTLYSKLTSD